MKPVLKNKLSTIPISTINSGIPIWEDKSSKEQEYHVCLTYEANRKLELTKNKRDYNPQVYTGGVPKNTGLISVGTVMARNYSEALEMALDMFHNVYVEGNNI